MDAKHSDLFGFLTIRLVSASDSHPGGSISSCIATQEIPQSMRWHAYLRIYNINYSAGIVNPIAVHGH